MSLFDTYFPDPPLACPVCGSLLKEWQGKEGPNGLFVWRQGEAAPVDQEVAEEVRLTPEDLGQQRLPQQFTIYASCCGGRFPVEAVCSCVDGVWHRTEPVTADNAVQKKDETQAEFQERLCWLRGNAR